MKCLETILVWTAGLLVFQLTAHAVTVNSTANPYQPIVVRNVFRLKSPAEFEADKPAPPPPVITLQGINSCCGRKQALLTVGTVLGPGDPPKRIALVLKEGSRYGEIEVLEINEDAGMVKVRIDGQIQALLLGHPPGRPG